LFAKKSCLEFVRVLGLRDEKIVSGESLPKRWVMAVGRKVKQGGAPRGNASFVDHKALGLRRSALVKGCFEKSVRVASWQ
jgi:hypothetical protein